VCHGAVSVVNQLEPRWADSPEVGLKVIVGSDDRAKLEEFAAKVSAKVYTVVDADSAMTLALRDLGYNGVPHWFVVNAKGNIGQEFAGLGGTGELLRELGLEKYSRKLPESGR
jgi:hypothetical protein